ncbi:unnamed protein product, partial [Larinioides sclopetarius]
MILKAISLVRLFLPLSSVRCKKRKKKHAVWPSLGKNHAHDKIRTFFVFLEEPFYFPAAARNSKFHEKPFREMPAHDLWRFGLSLAVVVCSIAQLRNRFSPFFISFST